MTTIDEAARKLLEDGREALRSVIPAAVRPFVRELACVVLHSPSRAGLGTCECPDCAPTAPTFYVGWCEARVILAAEALVDEDRTICDGDAPLLELCKAVDDLREARGR